MTAFGGGTEVATGAGGAADLALDGSILDGISGAVAEATGTAGALATGFAGSMEWLAAAALVVGAMILAVLSAGADSLSEATMKPKSENMGEWT